MIYNVLTIITFAALVFKNSATVPVVEHEQ